MKQLKGKASLSRGANPLKKSFIGDQIIKGILRGIFIMRLSGTCLR